jgi:hypothetical protein
VRRVANIKRDCDGSATTGPVPLAERKGDCEQGRPSLRDVSTVSDLLTRPIAGAEHGSRQKDANWTLGGSASRCRIVIGHGVELLTE